MNTDTETKNAAFWLDRACAYEVEELNLNSDKEREAKGRAKTLAFNAACRKDDEEHKADSATASLPRK